MTKVWLFLRHARRLKAKANKARRLAFAVGSYRLAQRLTTLALVWETKPVRAERCADYPRCGRGRARCLNERIGSPAPPGYLRPTASRFVTWGFWRRMSGTRAMDAAAVVVAQQRRIPEGVAASVRRVSVMCIRQTEHLCEDGLQFFQRASRGFPNDGAARFSR
jgi:hypothetical protein